MNVGGLSVDTYYLELLIKNYDKLKVVIDYSNCIKALMEMLAAVGNQTDGGCSEGISRLRNLLVTLYERLVIMVEQ
jgi:hypothetical protein